MSRRASPLCRGKSKVSRISLRRPPFPTSTAYIECLQVEECRLFRFADMPRFPGIFSGKSKDTGLYRKSFFRYPVRYSAAILEKWMDPFRGWIQRIGRGRFAQKRGLSLFPVLLFSRNGLRYIILLCPPRGEVLRPEPGSGVRSFRHPR